MKLVKRIVLASVVGATVAWTVTMLGYWTLKGPWERGIRTKMNNEAAVLESVQKNAPNEHALYLIQNTLAIQLARVGGLHQLSIRWSAPDDVAQPRCQLIITGGPGAAVAALVLDAINEPRRLQHRFDDQTHCFFVIASGAGDRCRDPAVQNDFVFFQRAAQNPLAHFGDQSSHVVVD